MRARNVCLSCELNKNSILYSLNSLTVCLGCFRHYVAATENALDQSNPCVNGYLINGLRRVICVDLYKKAM